MPMPMPTSSRNARRLRSNVMCSAAGLLAAGAVILMSGCEDPTAGSAASTGGRTSVPGKVMDRAEQLEQQINESQQEQLDLIDEMNGVEPGSDSSDARDGSGTGG